MEQIEIEGGGSLDGKTLISANLRQLYGVVVVGILRADKRMEFNPAPDVQMAAGDFLVVLGKAEGLRNLELAAAKTPPTS